MFTHRTFELQTLIQEIQLPQMKQDSGVMVVFVSKECPSSFKSHGFQMNIGVFLGDKTQLTEDHLPVCPMCVIVSLCLRVAIPSPSWVLCRVLVLVNYHPQQVPVVFSLPLT